MRCEATPQRDGSSCIEVVTPFGFFDGSGLSVFAMDIGDKVLFSDEGMTMFWLRGLGVSMDDRRAWRPIKSALAPFALDLSGEGVIETIAAYDEVTNGFARMVAAQLAVDAWARENVNAPSPALLRDEVALYLRAWRHQEVVMDPDPVQGFSGAQHRFAMRQGNEYIDAIGPSSASSGAEARKLLDVRASAAHAALDVRVVIDDRRDPDKAATEAAILGRFAKVWPLSKLVQSAGVSSAAH